MTPGTLDDNERLRIVLEGMGEAFYALDKDWRFLLASRAALEMWGKDQIEVEGQRFLDCFPQAEGTMPYQAHERVMAGGNAEQFQTVSPVLHRWIDVKIAPIPIGGLFVTIKDIDQSKRTEAALHESEARRGLLVEALAQAVWETDASGVVVADSPSWRAHTGQTLEEWLGYGWLDAIHPDDRAYAERQWREAVAVRGLVNAEFRLRAPDGGWRWTNVRAAPVLNAIGEIEKWAGMNIDIDSRKGAEAALKESEEKYRTLFETMGQGYCELELIRDADGRAVDQLYLAFNPAFERIFGIPIAEAMGHKASEVFPGVEATWMETFDRVAKTGIAERVEYQVAALGRWFEVHAYPQRGDRLTVLYEDVTERKRAEISLRDSEERQVFLLRLSDALRAEPDAHAVVDKAIRMLIAQLDLDRSYIVAYSLDQNRADLIHQVGNDRVPPLPDMFVLSDYPEAFRATLHQTLVIEDEHKRQGLSEAESSNSGALGMRAMVAATVRHGENAPLWSMIAISAEPRRWTQSEITLVEEVAERTWTAVERARAEAAPRESEERLRLIIESARDYAIFTLDTDRRVTEWPPGAEAVFGWTKAEIEGQTADILFTPEDREQNVPQIEADTALRDGMAPDVRWHMHKDGRRVFIEGQAVPLYRGERHSGFLKIGQDVTDRRAADVALRESEERLKLAIGVVELGTWDWNIETGLVVWSDLHYRLQGYAPGEIAPTYEAWAARVHPDDLPETEAALTAAREGRETYRHDFRTRLPDGEVRWMSALGWYFYDAAGTAIRMIGAMRDVTEEREATAAVRDSEARWRLLTDAMPNLVWVADAAAGEFVYVNEQFRKFTGHSAEDLQDSGWLSVIHPDDVETARAAWANARETGTIFDIEARIRSDTGNYRWHQVRAVAAPGNKARSHLWFGVCTDIQNLMEARFQAESADRAKSEFLANMSHEIRTPLNAVVGLTSLMLDFDPEPDMHAHYLRTMQDSARTLTERIDDVLEYARIDANMVELHESEVDLQTLLREVIGISAVKGREKGLYIDLHNFVGPATFIADGHRIKQIMLNLLSNAVKFTERGGVDVFVSQRKSETDRDVVAITVTDTGIGIAREHLERIFDKFAQADGTITRRFGGTGLGLAISRRLAETMGGRLEVQSELHKGSHFTLTLPLRASGIGSEIQPEAEALKPGRALYVLLVEDNPTNLLVARTMLTKLGHSFKTAGNGFEAIDAWRRDDFDVVLMDLQMPDMDGITAAKRLRQLERETGKTPLRIVAMSAHALDSDRARAAEAGMDDFLAKPFTASSLQEMLMPPT